MKNVVALLVFFVTTAAFAWGEKGHLMANEAATHAMPVDMPHFFYREYPRLVWLGYQPDRLRAGGEAINAFNPPNHFLDYEYVDGLELGPNRYKYLDLMIKSGRLRQHGLKIDEAGFLPWQIAELAELLQTEFRLWRFAEPGSAEQKTIESDIINTAGILGHFVADAANPHHSTMNYNGWALPNPEKFAIDCGVHSRFESQFVSHAVELAHVLPKIAAPVRRDTNYFATGLAFIKESNALVDDLYRIDRDAGLDFFAVPPPAPGVDFASGRIAAAAALLRDIWWSAWLNSSKAFPRVDGGD